ncbi:hypothetical protein AAFB97_002792 [Enterococcus faecium]
MLGEKFFEQIQKKQSFFMIFNILAIVFFSGSTFTFVIPGLYGFNWVFLFQAIAMYFIVASIFVGLIKNRIVLVFIISLILSILGMGWRFWLEWGEFTLVEYTNLVVAIGYPCILALLITLIYTVVEKIENK